MWKFVKYREIPGKNWKKILKKQEKITNKRLWPGLCAIKKGELMTYWQTFDLIHILCQNLNLNKN